MKGLLLSCVLAVAAQPAFSCGCQFSASVCNAVAYSNVVFIGTVESVAPSFLSNWNLGRRPSLNQLNQANQRYSSDASAENLTSLKDVFLKTFPDLNQDLAARLKKAKSQTDLVALFSAVLGNGKRIHFRVRTLFKNGGDDDDQPKTAAKTPATPAKDKDKRDDDATPQSFDVWTPFGDCGFDFQPGETYLVYAANDEETATMETDACMRTKRLSDAGPDLAYLYFFKDEKSPSARVEGFTTFDLMYQVGQAGPHDPDRINLPAPSVIVELKSPTGSRFTTPDPFGKFIFDGVAGGDHQVSAYAAGFPDTVKLLSGPKKVHLDAKGCAAPVLLIPK